MSAICSQCGHEMTLTRKVEAGPADPNAGNTGPWFFASAAFDCTNCEQQATVRPDGTGNMVLVNLHPTPRTPQAHHDYADYWFAEKHMFLGMSHDAGYIDDEEYDESRKELREKLEVYKIEHPLPRGFWANLRTRLT